MNISIDPFGERYFTTIFCKTEIITLNNILVIECLHIGTCENEITTYRIYNNNHCTICINDIKKNLIYQSLRVE